MPVRMAIALHGGKRLTSLKALDCSAVAGASVVAKQHRPSPAGAQESLWRQDAGMDNS